MPNVYATPVEIKAAANIRGVLDDDLILDTAEDVSRQIDQETGHRFYEETRSRFYTAESAHCVRVDDLLSVSAIAVDHALTRNYSSTYSATCIELGPANALYESPPHPYWMVETTPQSTGTFPTARRGVKLSGSWGFYAVTEPGGTFSGTSGVSSTGTTSVTISDPVRVQPGHTLKTSAGEQLYVNAVENGTARVERGVNGTTPATCAANATFGVYTYPVVRRACILQTARILARHESALGVVGGGDVGQIRLQAALDPDVKAMLARVTLPVAL